MDPVPELFFPQRLDLVQDPVYVRPDPKPASQYTYPQSNTLYLPKAVEGISCPALLGVGTPITAGRVIARLKPVVTALIIQVFESFPT